MCRRFLTAAVVACTIRRLLFARAVPSRKSLSWDGPREISFSCYLLNLTEVRVFDRSQLIAGGFSMGEGLIGGSKPDARERLCNYLRKYYEIIRG
jgi:hypothetical protein